MEPSTSSNSNEIESAAEFEGSPPISSYQARVSNIGTVHQSNFGTVNVRGARTVTVGNTFNYHNCSYGPVIKVFPENNSEYNGKIDMDKIRQ